MPKVSRIYNAHEHRLYVNRCFVAQMLLDRNFKECDNYTNLAFAVPCWMRSTSISRVLAYYTTPLGDTPDFSQQ